MCFTTPWTEAMLEEELCRPWAFNAPDTRIIASFITSAAVPWMGVFMATRLPRTERRAGEIEDYVYLYGQHLPQPYGKGIDGAGGP